MKALEEMKLKKNLTKKSKSEISKHNTSNSLKPYKHKKTLNFKLIGLLTLVVVSFCTIGMKLNQSQDMKMKTLSKSSYSVKGSSNETINYYNFENQKLSNHLQYKEINFDSYIEQLNTQDFTGYSEYLSYKSYVQDLFKADMRYNQRVFNSTHRITGKDSMKYIDFKKSQREISNQFRSEIQKHQNNFKQFIRTKRSVVNI
jgi:hypothetical protein